MHATGRGTADGEPAIRRYLRGSWHGGTRLDEHAAVLEVSLIVEGSTTTPWVPVR